MLKCVHLSEYSAILQFYITKSYTSMQNFTYTKLKTKNLFLVLFFALLAFNFYAQEGTRQVSPGNGLGAANANGTALLITAAQGSRPGSPADSKMKVTIVDHTVENIYAGLMARNFQNANTTIIDNAYLRITDPLGAVVFQRVIPANIGNGFIENYNKAWNGPNIFGSVPAGYTPFLDNANTAGTPTVNPTMNGDYIIEVYTSATGGSTFDSANSTYPFF